MGRNRKQKVLVLLVLPSESVRVKFHFTPYKGPSGPEWQQFRKIHNFYTETTSGAQPSANFQFTALYNPKRPKIIKVNNFLMQTAFGTQNPDDPVP